VTGSSGRDRPSTIVGVALGTRSLSITWNDGSVSRYHYVWLRDNCPQLADPSTGHRIVETSSIPGDCRPADVDIAGGAQLRITWLHDGHSSTFPTAWLVSHDYSNGVRADRPAPVLWDASMIDDIPRRAYPDVAADPSVRRQLLGGFSDYGLALLSDVPCAPGTVLEVAEMFGEVRATSWGRVFDVRSTVDANSLAYTSLPLPTHTDEGYRDPAPTIQLQHFLRADADGGASTLVDGYRLAADLRREQPEMFNALASTVLRFHYSDASTELECHGPVIDCFPDGEVRAIRFSNHSVAPFLLPFDEMEAFYTAYRTFGAMRESARYQLRVRFGSGDLYMVDNRRVLHGRTGFSGAERHLQSCYIERDELLSRLAVMNR
jgi:Taurine catabolism dioxygenase TauD, TfdA family/Gamma-butyrobetaine hydroxylase-like, N-terminal